MQVKRIFAALAAAVLVLTAYVPVAAASKENVMADATYVGNFNILSFNKDWRGKPANPTKLIDGKYGVGPSNVVAKDACIKCMRLGIPSSAWDDPMTMRMNVRSYPKGALALKALVLSALHPEKPPSPPATSAARTQKRPLYINIDKNDSFAVRFAFAESVRIVASFRCRALFSSFFDVSSDAAANRSTVSPAPSSKLTSTADGPRSKNN